MTWTYEIERSKLWLRDAHRAVDPWVRQGLDLVPESVKAHATTTFACASSHVDKTRSLAVTHLQQASTFELLRDLVFVIFVYQVLDPFITYIQGHGLFASIKDGARSTSKAFMRRVLTLPIIRGEVNKKLNKVLGDMDSGMIDRSEGFYSELPSKGWGVQKILGELDKNKNMQHADWENGRVSGAVYHGGEEMINMQAEAYRKFAIANQLHPDVFPGVRKMESEVVSMILKLFNAPETGCGTSTSGGTESLLLTSLAARELGRKRGITQPEILAPVTIHAGFNKAAYYFKMKLVHAPIDPVTYKVDLKALERLINKNTVLIAGSAPNFPHGIIDDIEGLSRLAVKYDLPLHVDACLGSLVVPFLDKIKGPDAQVPLFDFRLPGVTSISCDTHKYGFAPKGSSIIVYRTTALRENQYFVSTDWSGGVYASPTLAGSRPGALMVGCWASLMHIGYEGYLKLAGDIVKAAAKIRSAIEKDFPELYILGDPIVSVVAFASKQLDVYDLSDAMAHRGWHLNAVQNPAAVHIACTRLTVPVVGEFLADLRSSVDELKAKGVTGVSLTGSAALYGVAGSISTAGVVDRIAIGFLDNLYKL